MHLPLDLLTVDRRYRSSGLAAADRHDDVLTASLNIFEVVAMLSIATASTSKCTLWQSHDFESEQTVEKRALCQPS